MQARLLFSGVLFKVGGRPLQASRETPYMRNEGLLAYIREQGVPIECDESRRDCSADGN